MSRSWKSRVADALYACVGPVLAFLLSIMTTLLGVYVASYVVGAIMDYYNLHKRI